MFDVWRKLFRGSNFVQKFGPSYKKTASVLYIFWWNFFCIFVHSIPWWRAKLWPSWWGIDVLFKFFRTSSSSWRARCSWTSTQHGHSLIVFRLYSGPHPLTNEMRSMHRRRKSSTPTVLWKPGCIPLLPPWPSFIARA